MNKLQRNVADLSFFLFGVSFFAYLAGLYWGVGVEQLEDPEKFFVLARRWAESATIAFWIAGIAVLMSIGLHFFNRQLLARAGMRRQLHRKERWQAWVKSLIEKADALS